MPVLSPLFSDTLIAVTCERHLRARRNHDLRRPRSSHRLATVAVTSSPTLFLFERISASVVAENVAPAARPRDAGGGRRGAGVAAGVGAGGARRSRRGGLRLGRRPASGAGLGAAGFGARGPASPAWPRRCRRWAGRSAPRVVSTGASCRSRLRLSAEATSRLSPRPQAAAPAARGQPAWFSTSSPPRSVDLPGSRALGDIPPHHDENCGPSCPISGPTGATTSSAWRW